jgi:hypothetical protein
MSNHSNFWLDDYDIDWDFSEDSDGVDISNAQSQRTANLIRLSAARRAVANYVTILTNRTIPVLFNDQNMSMTDGKTVYIGSDINEKGNFDVSVGLALHEGSHICYSDFDMFKTIWQNIPREIYNYTEKLQIAKEKVADVVRTFLNIVEDRYIDYMVYKNAPGYRGYYESLYNKYFYASVIDDGLRSKLYRIPSIESYLYRLINITNKNTDLKALPGLYELAKILDLSNIARLDKPKDRLDVAIEMATLMFKNITEYDAQSAMVGPSSKSSPSESQPGSESEPTDDESDDQSDDAKDGTDDQKSEKKQKDGASLDDVLGGDTTKVDSVAGDAPVEDIGEDAKVSTTKREKIRKAFDKQKSFLKGDIKKKKVSKKENQILTVLEQSKIDLIDVGTEYLVNQNTVGAIECVLVNNMTRELVMSEEFPLGQKSSAYKDPFKNPHVVDMQTYINSGISMGIKIGKRLQFRNEVNIDKFSRRETGRIDKRLLHELGCESENVFYTIATSKYKKMNFHISVDASSSMRGNKWFRTMRLCTAIAKAASMLDNIRVTISFRTTMEKLPYVVIGYDSAVDKFVKIHNLFALLSPDGLTPEGLSFEAIMRTLPKNETNTENYFINISDGEPCYNYNGDGTDYMINYSGEAAARHTRKQVKKIREMGYGVLSYFIAENNSMSDKLNQLFKIMYADDAYFINVDNINQIVKTLNQKLMESVDL